MVSLGKTCLARATADRERTSARSIVVWKFSLAHASAAANLTGPCVMSIIISRTGPAHANTNGNSAVGAAVVVVTAAVIVTSKSLAHATAANKDTVTGETSHAHATAAIRACHCGEQDHRHQGNQPCTRSSERGDGGRRYTPPMSNHNLDVLDPQHPAEEHPKTSPVTTQNVPEISAHCALPVETTTTTRHHVSASTSKPDSATVKKGRRTTYLLDQPTGG